MAAFLDACRFSPTAGGTTDWTYSIAVTGYLSPATANVVNGRAYKYRAESADLAQWEIGEGTYNTSTGVLSRTTVLFNSAGTTAKINFSAIPQVAIVALKEDLISIEEANSFTAAQQRQARTNIGAAQSLSSTTTQVFLSGNGTYTTPANCTMIEVEWCGGSGGGAGSGTSPGNGGNGGNTTFGSSLLTGNGGGGGFASSGGPGGNSSGGYINRTGGSGQNGSGVNNTAGGNGGASPYGGVGWGGAAGAGAGVAPAANSGSGGGGGGVNATPNGGGGGGAGGSGRGIIVNPAATYSYAVGAAGTAGTAGTGGAAGAVGSLGFIVVIEHY
ncbi:hypothetical protein [Bradyrhizobium ivorense]|uniref:hypothetical protein n=1 Tax=Bradyrhizobium ivorense TaxID=2511166 RepID=UPI0010B7B400|nr:hypothetical protein [Bradyrhizobium ivorense]VIO77381.1 hypothetical protein CI41S_56360 [Bradyrhizobium ivorense]